MTRTKHVASRQVSADHTETPFGRPSHYICIRTKLAIGVADPNNYFAAVGSPGASVHRSGVLGAAGAISPK